MFDPLKKLLKHRQFGCGHRGCSGEVIAAAMREFFAEEIHQLVQQWDTCIIVHGAFSMGSILLPRRIAKWVSFEQDSLINSNSLTRSSLAL
jgi:hypothetical protein